MKQYKAYLIDLDGTVYFGKNRIPTAEQFVKKLLVADIPFLFVTNNATKSPEEVAENLATNYDLPVTANHCYTSALALIDYLNAHHPNARIHVVGEASLKNLIQSAGYTIEQTNQADVVVQALDRQATYESLATAAQAIRNGAAFLVTNTDRSIPTENGMMPSSGALTAFLQHTTRVEPVVMGKPYRPILEGCLHQLGLSVEEVLMIGDNYETDIRVGIDAGMDTLLVLTGVTSKADVADLPVAPTYVLQDLSEWELAK
ncbi:TIGR01457 family HAD-type hydrolase [Tuanshanicoccus lijuaniae]|uniref:TIGR01457 family HAD-type hydrolase n=1 Tax=Aerococcaceae bacterium zg-1292 TaxID=2774330 RepID=UPI001936AD74|nr:TIGR01457 family HAD-type hydrolase [Aerococcaceae bacterium zg-1292]MBF6624990.1 TIGR01457 family HAD-type hydrolase [Aerococcaceae bacterium zg-BR9]MBF6626257.1 TIGR01457 family HAD-type hydrolase [Aerococcaceae bacterium zg-BR9]QQA37600.1 TIGR01457 family HAD-type hydrolase [Aerococcaceae bacterium zg-1292]